MTYIFTPFPLQSAHLIAVKQQVSSGASESSQAIIASVRAEIEVCKALWAVGTNKEQAVQLAVALAVDLARIPQLDCRGARLSSRELLHAIMEAGAMSSVTEFYPIFHKLEQHSFFEADLKLTSAPGILSMGAGFASLKDALQGSGLRATASLGDASLGDAKLPPLS